jgi:hypothetical protein
MYSVFDYRKDIEKLPHLWESFHYPNGLVTLHGFRAQSRVEQIEARQNDRYRPEDL